VGTAIAKNIRRFYDEKVVAKKPSDKGAPIEASA